MAEKVYDTSKLINLHSADGTTLLIPKIPLSTVDNNAYTVDAEGNISTKGAGVSLQSAVQAEIAAAVADSVVGNYVPWTDGSNVVIPGTLTVEGDTTLAGVTATNADITGTLDVTGKATLSDALDVAGAATLKGAVRVEGKLVAAQDMYIETTADGSTTSTKVATMADIDGITGGTLNNYYTKGEVDAIAEGTLEDANVYTDSASTALSAQITALDTKVTTDYATKVYVGEQIAAIDHLKREIVTELPTGEAIDTNTIYMVKMGDQGANVYREYMYIEGKWEIVGDSNIDFSNYYTKGEVDTKIGSYYTKGEVDAALADYVTTEDFNGSIANYALKTELQSTSSTLNAAVVDASSALSAEIAAVDSKFADYALTTYVDAQDGSTLTSANEYADAAVSTAASALNASIVAASSVLNDSITAVDGKFASYYDKDTVDATFAPIDGATLTNVVSITGTDAHIAVSKVTATEL